MITDFINDIWNKSFKILTQEAKFREMTQKCIDILVMDDLHPEIETRINDIWAYLSELSTACGVNLEEYQGE